MQWSTQDFKDVENKKKKQKKLTPGAGVEFEYELRNLHF